MPVLRRHGREQREGRGLGLPAGGGREQEGVSTIEDRVDGMLLQRPQRRPTQRVDDVVSEDRVEPVDAR